MGAWIETLAMINYFRVLMSRPSWARGLKLAFGKFNLNIIDVASLVGAWIETLEPMHRMR